MKLLKYLRKYVLNLIERGLLYSGVNAVALPVLYVLYVLPVLPKSGF